MKTKKKLYLFSILVAFLFVMFLSANISNAATEKIDISKGYDYWIQLSTYTYEYTGKEIKPEVTLNKSNSTGNPTKLKKGTDYKVSYKNNTEIGYAQITVTGIGKYKGTKTSGFTICKYDIAKAKVTAIPDQEYTGKQIKPEIKSVKYKDTILKEGVDYSVSYTIYQSGTTPIGTSYASISGIGEYKGYKSIPFNVVPPKIKNVKTTLKSNGINISWKKSSIDVDGYEIERKTSTNKKYTILTTLDKSKTSYLDTTPATSGKTYYYRVRSYKIVNGAKIYSNYSNISEIIFVQGVTYTLTSGNDRTYLKWNKVNGADSYQIFRSTSKNGEYVRIKTQKGENKISYTDKKVKKYTTYYYKIRAYVNTPSGKVYGKFTDIQVKTPLAQTKLKKVNYTGKTIKLSWNKVNNIKGYKIYRATSENGKYSKIATVSAKKTSYTDKKLSQGKVYFYRIRAYKNKNNKTLYGQYSDVKLAVTGNRKQQMNKTKLNPDKDFKNSDFKSYYKDYENLIKKNTNSSMSTYTKVNTMYKYLVNHLYHKDGYHCKNFAGTFAGICRVMGLDAYCATGETKSGSGYTAHTWTIVNINGTEYIFDASLERHNTDRTKKISNKYFFKTYSELPKVYKFQGYENWWPFFMVGKSNLK